MGSKYTTQSISGYNATPPADDGSAVEANKVKWATHKDKLADPIKTLAEAIDTAMVSYVDRQPLAKSTAYTTVLTDHLRTIETTGTTTITLGAVATMGTGYTTTVKNAGTGVVTVEGSGSETIDGNLNITLTPDQSVTCVVDNAGGSYLRSSQFGGFDAGTLMLFQQTAAPTGWTKETTHNDKALRVVTGTASSGGTDTYSTVFARTTTDSHTLAESEIPAHTHTVNYAAGGGAVTNISGTTASVADNLSKQTDSTGGGGGHTHNLSNFDLQYVDVIIASKD